MPNLCSWGLSDPWCNSVVFSEEEAYFGSPLDQIIEFHVILGRFTAFHNCPEEANSAVIPGETSAVVALDL